MTKKIKNKQKVKNVVKSSSTSKNTVIIHLDKNRRTGKTRKRQQNKPSGVVGVPIYLQAPQQSIQAPPALPALPQPIRPSQQIQQAEAQPPSIPVATTTQLEIPPQTILPVSVYNSQDINRVRQNEISTLVQSLRENEAILSDISRSNQSIQNQYSDLRRSAVANISNVKSELIERQAPSNLYESGTSSDYAKNYESDDILSVFDNTKSRETTDISELDEPVTELRREFDDENLGKLARLTEEYKTLQSFKKDDMEKQINPQVAEKLDEVYSKKLSEKAEQIEKLSRSLTEEAPEDTAKLIQKKEEIKSKKKELLKKEKHIKGEKKGIKEKEDPILKKIEEKQSQFNILESERDQLLEEYKKLPRYSKEKAPIDLKIKQQRRELSVLRKEIDKLSGKN